MNMLSLLGYANILLIILFLLNLKGLWKPNKKAKFMIITAVYIQLLHILADLPFVQLLLFIFYCVLIARLSATINRRREIYAIILLLVCSTIYSELFNGIESFENRQDFFITRNRVKKYFWLTPCKIYEKNNNTYVFSLQSRSEIALWGFTPKSLVITRIKIEDGRAYYLKTRQQKLGKLPLSEWFEFGEEEDWGSRVAFLEDSMPQRFKAYFVFLNPTYNVSDLKNSISLDYQSWTSVRISSFYYIDIQYENLI
jgi:hypothetical protein